VGKHIALLILSLFCAAAPAQAEEKLAMPKFPGGWIEAFAKRGGQEIVEYVPPGQTAQTWQRKITLEVYPELKNLPLDTLQRRAAAQNRDACTGVREGAFQSGVNNGYASAFWTLGCERDRASGFGETRYTKAIQGAERLYLLTYVWRTQAYGKAGPGLTPHEVDEVMAFLTSSVLCDTSSAERHCPPE
jgi:hypothetical protein